VSSFETDLLLNVAGERDGETDFVWWDGGVVEGGDEGVERSFIGEGGSGLFGLGASFEVG